MENLSNVVPRKMVDTDQTKKERKNDIIKAKKKGLQRIQKYLVKRFF